MKRILWLFLLSVAGNLAYGNGYQVMLQSNRVTSMGNAGTGVVLGGASIFFNPGALGFVNQSEVHIGFSMVNGRTNYVATNSFTQYEARPQTPSGHAYYVWADSASKFRAGLGLFAPFGSTVEWKDGWAGRYALTSLELKAYYIQPTVAYKISDKLSVGAGFDIMIGSVNLQRDISIDDASGMAGHSTLDGKTKTGFGYNLGVFIKPSEKFSVGLTYRSKIMAKVVDGDTKFEVAPGAQYLFPENKFSASLPLPSVTTLGLGFAPSAKVSFAFDVNYVGWGAYDALTIHFKNAIPALGGATSTVGKRNYENSFIFHLGTEVKVMDKLALRAGGYYDQSPVPNGYMTPETPDSDAIGLTCGFGFHPSKKISIDGSFLYLNKKQRDNAAAPDAGGISGTFKSSALIPGIGITIKL